MGGSAPRATPIQLSGGTPPKPPPGYGPVKAAFEQIFPQLFGASLPSYQGQVDPGLSPTMQNLIRGAQTYSQSPFPKSLEQASGTLGAFQNFDKLPGASRPYEFDPSHRKMYEFQNPFLPNPQQGQGPPPQYGFNPQPQVPGMAEGGAGGYGAGKIVRMAEGGGGGFGWGIPGWSQITPGFNGNPFESGGYWWSPQGQLAFNPNAPDGRFADSKYGQVFQWMADQGIFTPGQQHGPNAQPWDAIPPSGYEGGRSGPIDPTDPLDPHRTPYGWWTADPSQLGGGQQMPPWLSGLNDEEMAHVFDLVGKVPPGMEQPWDWIGEQIAAEGLIDLPGPNAPSRSGGGRGRGGGGPSISIPFSGVPGYNPVEVNPSFVAWDPGNPTPSMVPGNNVMPPPMPPSPAPPEAAPPAPGGGGGGGGGGGAPRPRPPAPPPAAVAPPPMGPGLPGMPMPFFPIHRGPTGGGGGRGFRPGGGAPSGSPSDEIAGIPMFAKGNVVDHPQLAMIGEAGPEVVMPLTRPAAHPGIRKMQDKLGLPATPMATGGAAGLGGNMLQQKPAQQPWQVSTMSAPGSTVPGGPSSTLGRIPGMNFGMSSITGNRGFAPNFQNLGQGRDFPGAMPGQAPWKPSAPLTPAGAPKSWDLGSWSNALGTAGQSPTLTPLPGRTPLGGGRMAPPGIGPGALQGGMASSVLAQKPGQKPWQVSTMPTPGLGPGRDFPGAMPGAASMIGSLPPGLTDSIIAQMPGSGMQFQPAQFKPPGAGQGRDFPGAMPAAPPGSPPGQQPTQPQDPFSGPTSAMDVYRSSVPVMNRAMEGAISDAMAQSGISGNRFSTSALNTAGKIGQEAGMAQNQLMSQLLYDQTNQDLNRSLQATGMGLEDSRFRNQLGFQGEQNALDRAMQAAGLGGQFGQMQDQMSQDRLKLPFGIGAWEQGRADQFARMPYDDFMQSRLGFLPYLFDLMASQGGSGGMSPQFGVQQTGGSPGALDYISALAPIFGMFMARGGAAGSGASAYLEGGY